MSLRRVTAERKRTLQLVLHRDHMAPIARIARVDVRAITEVEPLNMPERRCTTATLIAAAECRLELAAVRHPTHAKNQSALPLGHCVSLRDSSWMKPARCRLTVERQGHNRRIAVVTSIPHLPDSVATLVVGDEVTASAAPSADQPR